ncbi:MAG: hypothetical protein ABSG03_37405 [Bryobacteraceae bacterium]|jgi:hypothetical protein
MPVTVFDIKGLPGHRRERIEAAVVAGGKHTKAPQKAWIAADLLGTTAGHQVKTGSSAACRAAIVELSN